MCSEFKAWLILSSELNLTANLLPPPQQQESDCDRGDAENLQKGNLERVEVTVNGKTVKIDADDVGWS